MPTCTALGCTNRTGKGKKKEGLSFFRFPRNNKVQFNAWVRALRRENWQPSPHSTLCSEHFTEDQIDRTALFSVHLRENAVPSIFEGHPSYLQKVCCLFQGRDMEEAELVEPLFVQVKEELNSESDEDAGEEGYESNDMTEHLLADISSFPKQEESMTMSDSIEDAVCTDNGGEHFDSHSRLREAIEGTSFIVEEGKKGYIERRLEENESGRGGIEERAKRTEWKEMRWTRERLMFASPNILSEERRRKYSGGPLHCESTHCIFHLKNHQRVHKGERPYTCTVCGKACNLASHMRIHSEEKPFKCERCGKGFKKRQVFVNHIRSHKGKRHYKCTACGKACNSSAKLASHMRIHSEEKPFECERCRKSFRYRHHLANHIRTHTSLLPAPTAGI